VYRLSSSDDAHISYEVSKKSKHFNKHLEHYTSMKLIFRNSTTTKKFANGSNNDAYLEIEAIEEEGYNVPTTH
jgi:hypothetical protein